MLYPRKVKLFVSKFFQIQVNLQIQVNRLWIDPLWPKLQVTGSDEVNKDYFDGLEQQNYNAEPDFLVSNPNLFRNLTREFQEEFGDDIIVEKSEEFRSDQEDISRLLDEVHFNSRATW